MGRLALLHVGLNGEWFLCGREGADSSAGSRIPGVRSRRGYAASRCAGRCLLWRRGSGGKGWGNGLGLELLEGDVGELVETAGPLTIRCGRFARQWDLREVP